MNTAKTKLSNQELLKMIKNALYTEENAMAVYGRHLKTVLSFSDIAAENRKKIREYLDLLIKESEEHKNILIVIMNKLKEKEEN